MEFFLIALIVMCTITYVLSRYVLRLPSWWPGVIVCALIITIFYLMGL